MRELTMRNGRVESGGTVIVCDDCGHERQTTEPNPTLVSCNDCGSRNVRYAEDTDE